MTESTAAQLTQANRRNRELDKLVQSLTLDIEDLEGHLQRAKERQADQRRWVRMMAGQIHEERHDLTILDELFEAFEAEETARARTSAGRRAKTPGRSTPAQAIAASASSATLTWLLDAMSDWTEAAA